MFSLIYLEDQLSQPGDGVGVYDLRLSEPSLFRPDEAELYRALFKNMAARVNLSPSIALLLTDRSVIEHDGLIEDFVDLGVDLEEILICQCALSRNPLPHRQTYGLLF